MTDTAGGAKVPQSFGEKLAFGIPAIIVALILSVGISFAIISSVNGKTMEEVNAVNDKAKRLEGTLSEVKKVNDDLQKEVAMLTEKAKKSDETTKVLTTELTKVGSGLEKVANEYSSFVQQQATVDKTQNQDLGKHEANINALETKVRYIDEKLKKLDELAGDVNGLKNDVGGLKTQYVTLKDDLQKVRAKGEITEKDLADLSERARLFQLRVLAARAREAAEAARQTDLKSLLSRLEDVEAAK
jgi:septal ring factor EnvC (AmiA/AmiB activator)